jgi:hypothetical protein
MKFCDRYPERDPSSQNERVSSFSFAVLVLCMQWLEQFAKSPEYSVQLLACSVSVRIIVPVFLSFFLLYKILSFIFI